MFGSSSRLLCIALLFFTSCTAGDYEVAPCGQPKSLAADPCNALNTEPNKCEIYQCDSPSGACKLGTRDYDRDGDPDVVCGGKDCDDFDADKNGFNQTCSCDPTLIGKDCFVGVGACRVKSVYSCMSGSLFCAQANSPPTSVDYMSRPEPTTGSWDWDCSNSIELGCRATPTSPIGSCPAVSCDAALSDSIGKKNFDAACDTYCGRINPLSSGNCKTGAAPVILCGTECGQPILTCNCAKSGLTSCVRDANQKTGVNYVLCK